MWRVRKRATQKYHAALAMHSHVSGSTTGIIFPIDDKYRIYHLSPTKVFGCLLTVGNADQARYKYSSNHRWYTQTHFEQSGAVRGRAGVREGLCIYIGFSCVRTRKYYHECLCWGCLVIEKILTYIISSASIVIGKRVCIRTRGMNIRYGAGLRLGGNCISRSRLLIHLQSSEIYKCALVLVRPFHAQQCRRASL